MTRWTVYDALLIVASVVVACALVLLGGCADWQRAYDPSVGEIQGHCLPDATCSYPNLACVRSFGAGYRCLPKNDACQR